MSTTHKQSIGSTSKLVLIGVIQVAALFRLFMSALHRQQPVVPSFNLDRKILPIQTENSSLVQMCKQWLRGYESARNSLSQLSFYVLFFLPCVYILVEVIRIPMSLNMAFCRLLPFVLSVTVFLLEIGFVKLAEVGLRTNEEILGTPSALSVPAHFSGADVPPKQKKLEISSFKTENRKVERNKELVNKSNVTVTPIKESFETALYRVHANDGSTCIKLQVDAILDFKYLSKLEKLQEKDLFIPTGATVTGDCSEEDQQNLVLRWGSFVLKWYFSKTPGGERWFVIKIELKYDPNDRIFEHIKPSARSSYVLSSIDSHTNYLFPTPVGMSYKCDREIKVQLSSYESHTVSTLLLRELKVEPFIFKNDEFGAEYMCAATGSGAYRSETAPLIAGSMLAAACLLTVSGYALYRFFNVEKVQYGTME